MTPDETRYILGYASAIDPRVRRNDSHERQLQVLAWHEQLGKLTAEQAKRAIDAHYAKAGASAALPGDILDRSRALGRGTHSEVLPAYRPASEVMAEINAKCGATESWPALEGPKSTRRKTGRQDRPRTKRRYYYEPPKETEGGTA